MLELLQGWGGAVNIDGTTFNTIEDIPSDLKITDNMVITLTSQKESSAGQIAEACDDKYRVFVRQYMTKPSTPTFDFMAKWNNDVPMPLRVMVGTYDKQTPGMYHMILHGDILEEKTQFCMKCGRPITNPVSQYFGMGPECGGHNYTNPFESNEELKQAVSNYKKELQNITWTGWVIKSAIENMEEL